jgi:membrane protein required for colicin V production
MNLAALDIIFLIILLIATFRCVIKGFVSEIMSLAALILGIGGAVLFSGAVARFLDNQFGTSVWNQVISFLVIFLVLYIVVKAFEGGIKRLLERLNLGSLDRALGFFLGVAEGFILVSVIIIVLRLQPFFDTNELLEGSIIAGIVINIIPYGLELIGEKI